ALTQSGRIRSLFNSPEGGATLTLSAGNLDGLTKLAAKLDPAIGEAIEARFGRASSLNVRATLAINSTGKHAGQSAATIQVDGAAGARRLHFEGRAAGDPGEFDKLEIVAKGNLATDEGAELVRLLGLTQWLNVVK